MLFPSYKIATMYNIDKMKFHRDVENKSYKKCFSHFLKAEMHRCDCQKKWHPLHLFPFVFLERSLLWTSFPHWVLLIKHLLMKGTNEKWLRLLLSCFQKYPDENNNNKKMLKKGVSYISSRWVRQIILFIMLS